MKYSAADVFIYFIVAYVLGFFTYWLIFDVLDKWWEQRPMHNCDTCRNRPFCIEPSFWKLLMVRVKGECNNWEDDSEWTLKKPEKK